MQQNRSKYLIYNILIIYITSISCKKNDKIFQNEIEVLNAWAGVTIDVLKLTPGNTPTYASRSLGYIGLTLYETSISGKNTEYQSISNELNGLQLNTDSTKAKLPIVAIIEGARYILKNVYVHTSPEGNKKIDSLYQITYKYVEAQNFEKQAITQSKNTGTYIAKTIFEWSKTDGGYKGYLNNFDKKLQFTPKPGGWKPPLYGQSFSHFPLHPHWGKNRPFLTQNGQIEAPKFISYSLDSNSAYYKQFLSVYKKNKNLTLQEKEAAIWWGDDPDETPTPPGHSLYLAKYVVEKDTNTNLQKAAATYAAVGIAVADAFRNCWKWKYEFFSERPNTFITEHIDANWESFWPDPPFPAFPSGHAIQAAATATILENIYGKNFTIEDKLHQGRPNDALRNVAFKNRKFNTFWDIAIETANSRYYGGIHCEQDNEAGLIKGREVAQNINKLSFKR